MGKILSNYRTSIVSDLIDTLTTNTHNYYGIATGAVPNLGNVQPDSSDNYNNQFLTSWQLLFGKKISNNDVKPMIVNNPWVSNTVYSRYDNTPNTFSENANTYANTNYYVIVPPGIYGGGYNIYICIDNANSSPSTEPPLLIQPTSFQTSDNYIWRYITTISSFDYVKFATSDYVPVYANVSLSAAAYNYSGIDNVIITNSGKGYSSHNDGIIRSVVNTTLIQIDSSFSNSTNTPSIDNDFYTNNGIYIYDPTTSTSQYFGVAKYVSNTSGVVQTNWIYLDAQANLNNIVPGVTQYKISPKVVFKTDATIPPVAYSVIDTVANTISEIVVIDPGIGVTWANISIQSNTSYPTANSGNRANAYVVVPPNGGHGYDPLSELKVAGIGISFTFANNENNHLPTYCLYNKIGIVKDPYGLVANTYVANVTTISQDSSFANQYFTQVLVANITPTGVIFTVGDSVTGSISNALGTVVFSNSSQIGLVGDKYFANNEPIVSSSGTLSANININTFGQIYPKNLDILYVQNLTDVQRSNTQSENYKIVIQI